MNSNRLGIVVDGYSTGKHLPEAFSVHGFDVLHVQSSPVILPFDLPSFKPENFRENFVFDGQLEELCRRLEKYRPKFVLAGCESGVKLADRLASALGLGGNGETLSEARRDKGQMADALERAGLRRIRHKVCKNSQDAYEWLQSNGFQDVVVKPLDSAGTEDVYFCSDQSAVERAMGLILGKVNGMGSFNTAALVQERVLGDQYTINTVSLEGRHHLAELWTYETVPIPGAGSLCDHEVLLDASASIYPEIEAYVKAVLDALEIRQGPAHIEIFVDGKGPVLIELGARMQGSMSRRARTRALGHDHVSLTAFCFADPIGFERFVSDNQTYTRINNAQIVSLISDQTVEVANYAGLQCVQDLASFADAICLPAVGEIILPSSDLSSTAGIVYLVHEDAEVIDRDRKYLKSLSVKDLFCV